MISNLRLLHPSIQLYHGHVVLNATRSTQRARFYPYLNNPKPNQLFDNPSLATDKTHIIRAGISLCPIDHHHASRKILTDRRKNPIRIGWTTPLQPKMGLRSVPPSDQRSRQERGKKKTWERTGLCPCGDDPAPAL